MFLFDPSCLFLFYPFSFLLFFYSCLLLLFYPSCFLNLFGYSLSFFSFLLLLLFFVEIVETFQSCINIRISKGLLLIICMKGNLTSILFLRLSVESLSFIISFNWRLWIFHDSTIKWSFLRGRRLVMLWIFLRTIVYFIGVGTLGIVVAWIFIWGNGIERRFIARYIMLIRILLRMIRLIWIDVRCIAIIVILRRIGIVVGQWLMIWIYSRIVHFRIIGVVVLICIDVESVTLIRS